MLNRIIRTQILIALLIAFDLFFDNNWLNQNPSSLSHLDLFPSAQQNCQVYQQSRAITVKVISDKIWGSGIIMARQNNTYTVVTNYHVLIFARKKIYQIQTPDGRIYEAIPIEKAEFAQKDLTLLEFNSEQDYTVATVAPVIPQKEEEVFATGFPLSAIESNDFGFICTKGKIAMIMSQPLQGGYQIGYTNEIYKGMSGGPVLNSQGQVIAINGKSPPLWGNPFFAFEDGTVVSDEKMIEQMKTLSWSIPINNVLKVDF